MGEGPRDQDWRGLAEKLGSVGYALLDYAKVPITERGASDVNVVAVALLCRTLSNLKGAILLAQNGKVIEARTLARSCTENLILVGALGKRGYDLVKEMAFDDLARRIERGEFFLAGRYHPSGSEQDTALRGFIKSIRKILQRQKRMSLDPKSVARGGPVADAYAIYTQLSSDAAHPTAESLSRYLTRSVEGGELCLDVEPGPNESELSETWKFLCSAVLGVVIGVNVILGVTAISPSIHEVANEYAALAQFSDKIRRQPSP